MLAWIVFVHMLALGLLSLSPVSGWRFFLLAGVVLGGLAVCAYRWRHPGYTALCWRDGSWTLLLPQEEKTVELISHQSLAGMQLLNFRGGRRRWMVALLPDSSRAKELRHLRQLLMLGKANSS